VTTNAGKSWNLVRPFSRPGKSWKTAKVMENNDDIQGFFLKCNRRFVSVNTTLFVVSLILLTD